MTKLKQIGRAIAMALAVLVLPVAVSGCATFARITGQEQAATYDEKALISAELAYSFVLQTVIRAAQAGALDAEQATEADRLITAAQEAIVRARRAYAAGNDLDGALATQDVVTQVAALTALLEAAGLLRRGG